MLSKLFTSNFIKNKWKAKCFALHCMKCHVCCMKTSETSQAFLSEEFRGVEEEAEVDADVPVVGGIGEVVSV